MPAEANVPPPGTGSLIMPVRLCCALVSSISFSITEASTPLFCLLFSAAASTAGSSLNPWIKCRPIPMAKIAVRVPGFADFRNFNTWP